MRTRIANKINHTASVFGNWDINYLPYSVPQQQKAIKALKLPQGLRNIVLRYGVFRKVPTEYRKYNTIQIMQVMKSRNMHPSSVKEYRKFMKKILTDK